MRTSSLRSRVSHWRDEANFRLRRPDWEQVISDHLPFGQDGVDQFQKAVSSAESYLEYGAGSSTLWASAEVPSLVSVESDGRFLKAVESLCFSAAPLDDKCTREFIFADIGGTGAWGIPTYKRPTRSRVDKWRAYPLAPWLRMGLDYRADTILIDGRFRVACALAVVVMQPDIEWTLLFDDYVERPEYWAFEAFADRVGMHGRMAEFRPKTNVNAGVAQISLNTYLHDWR